MLRQRWNSIADWLAWAEERLAQDDPLAGGVGGVFRTLADVREWSYRD